MAEESVASRFWRQVMRYWPTGRSRDVPWTPLARPLAASRVALVTTCGVHRKADPPFDLADPRGDASFRELPAEVDAAALTITHGHYDERAARRDLNVVFPLERLRGLAAEGLIGAVAPRHYGFMGSIKDPRPLVRDSAPEVARRLRADAVDVVLLTPC